MVHNPVLGFKTAPGHLRLVTCVQPRQACLPLAHRENLVQKRWSEILGTFTRGNVHRNITTSVEEELIQQRVSFTTQLLMRDLEFGIQFQP